MQSVSHRTDLLNSRVMGLLGSAAKVSDFIRTCSKVIFYANFMPILGMFGQFLCMLSIA